MKDHELAKLLVATSAYFGLFVAAFVMMIGIAAAGINVSAFFAQPSAAQVAAAEMSEMRAYDNSINRPGVPNASTSRVLPVAHEPEQRASATSSDVRDLHQLANVAACPNLTRTLGRGMDGQDVTELQNFLVSQGFLASSTGHFGPLTEQAVKNWQASTSIVATGTASTTGFGVVGKQTRAALAACKTPLLNSSAHASTTDSRPPMPPMPHNMTPTTTVSIDMYKLTSDSMLAAVGAGGEALDNVWQAYASFTFGIFGWQ